MHPYEYLFPLPPPPPLPAPCRYVPEAVLFPTDPNFLQFHKVFEAFQVISTIWTVSLSYDINSAACRMCTIELVIYVAFFTSRFRGIGLGAVCCLPFLFVTMATCIIGGFLWYIDVAFLSLWQHMYVIGVKHDKQLNICMLYFAVVTGVSGH